MAAEKPDEQQHEDPEFITPPNTLKNKVTPGGPGAVDMAMLERAEQVIADMADNYLDWVEEDLKKISAAYDGLVAGDGDRKENLDRIFELSHDMKGQGGSFGYDLMTAIGNQLCRLIERLDGTATPETENEAIRIHIDSMKLVIAKRMKGDGGREGTAILDGIEQMVRKLVPAQEGD